jgi:serine/threonine protein kinase
MSYRLRALKASSYIHSLFVQNIVKLLGVCTRNEPVYTVMEYMLYGDLKTYLLARRHLVNERNREELDEVSNRLEPVLNK